MSALDAVLDDPSIQEEFLALHPTEQAVINWQLKWLGSQAYKHQIEPSGDWWSVWLMLAGRGAGKTRAAAETLAWWAWEQPNTRWLVSAPTSNV
jgi:phage terminase large subunit-like protein